MPLQDEIKRYVVVAYSCYYPIGFEDDVFTTGGRWEGEGEEKEWVVDKDGRFHNLDVAKAYVADNFQELENCDIVYIFDLLEWKKVWNKKGES